MRPVLELRSGIVLLCALVLAAAPRPADGAAPLIYSGQWGSFGAANSQFNTPYGVDVSAAMHVYVSDYINNNIQEFTLAGDFVRKFGSGGTGAGQLNAPYGIVSDRGYVYVVENQNHRVSKFSITGTFVTSWGGILPGNTDGMFRDPTAVVADTAGNIYVADTDNDRVQKFTPAGTFLTKWGSFGDGNGQFQAPSGLIADHQGFVYVVDTGNNRVEKFDAAGNFVLAWGSFGSGPGQFSQPNGGAEDPWGNIYVVDTGNDRVEKFTSAGVYLGEFGSAGSLNGQLLGPFSAAGTQSGDVYVADSYNSRIQWFTLNAAAGVGGAPGQPGLAIAPSANPVRGPVTLRFSLPGEESPRISVHDATGRLVWGARPGRLAAGAHEVHWDLRAATGERVAPGVYFARLESASGTRVSKIAVLN